MSGFLENYGKELKPGRYVYTTVAKRWNQPKYPPADEWINNISAQWNIVQPQRNGVLIYATT